MNTGLQKSLLSVSGIALLAVGLLFVNGISDALFSRFYIDLTEDGLYSLSTGSRNVLRSVKDPIELKFYFSKTDGAKYPALKMYGTRIIDLLREYERESGGMLTLSVYDPRPDSEEEEWAQKYGLTPIPLPTGERIFFGLVGLNSLGTEETIPVFDLSRQEFLEYDVTRLVDSLRSGEKPVVGIISPLKIEGQSAPPPMPGRFPPPQSEEPWILANQLEKIGEVRYLGVDVSEIPTDVKVLMVIHPKNLPEQTRYAIDQFVVKGGNLFLAVDPHCGIDQPPPDPGNPMAALAANRSSDLPEMMKAWGVSLSGKSVVGDIRLATRVSAGQGSAPQSFPVWISVSAGAAADSPLINQEDVTTSKLETMMLAWPGALEVTPVEGITAETLFSTTTDSMLYPENDIRFGGDNPESLLKKFQRSGKSHVLGVKLTGKFKSSFPGKPGAENDQNMSTPGGHVAEGTAPATVIVISDVDFLADRFSAVSQSLLGTRLVRLLNDNLIFAANAVENLTGSSDLISLRSRGTFTRPFTKVQEIEARAQERWKQEEEVLQAKLNAANQRLSQLQAGGTTGEDGKQVFSQALLDEIKKFREDRHQAQESLRIVRRKLREDKEKLGGMLFAINTFGVPVLLVVGVLVYYRQSERKRSAQNRETAEPAAG